MGNFPPEVWHILAPASGSLNVPQLTQMAKQLMKLPSMAKQQPATLLTSPVPSVSPLSHLKDELAQLAGQVASLQEPTASSSRSQPSSTAWPAQSSSSRPTSAATCWYHITFGAKARRYISPYSFVSQQSKRTFEERRSSTSNAEVTSVGHLKAADPDTPPDEPCSPLPPAPAPPSSSIRTYVVLIPSPPNCDQPPKLDEDILTVVVQRCPPYAPEKGGAATDFLSGKRWEVWESDIPGVEARTEPETLTWLGPPVVTVAQDVTAGKSLAARSHRSTHHLYEANGASKCFLCGASPN
ncbi:unnamed protein product [Schistocephalus solidus]|uniref:Integrase core domain containing protein n=1 Tax=Schistocephalus solidus TaxID=70667 RepID=A0A183T380_SCHSO|nr:unnamed protein product [Schistocephalus solidus]